MKSTNLFMLSLKKIATYVMVVVFNNNMYKKGFISGDKNN